MSDWTDAHLERLKVLWAEGLSAAQVSKILATEFRDARYSRNAVIGKVHRAGLHRGSASAPRSALHNVARGGAAALAKARALTRPVAPPATVVELRPQARVFGATKVKPILKLAGGGMVFEECDAPAPRAITKDEAFLPLEGVPPVAFEDRLGARCRWPVDFDQPGHWCCGARTEDAARYCITHEQISCPDAGKPKAAKDEERYVRHLLKRFAA